MMPMRLAVLDDVAAIELLIASSVRELSRGFYSQQQAESALQHVFGVDSALIADGSYYVIEDELGLAAAGFTRLELVATMPGVPLYSALGFELGEQYPLALPDGVSLPVANMHRGIAI